MPQLSRGAEAPGAQALSAVLADPAITLLAACDGETIVGLAVVAVYRRLSGVSAHLHDVVVDGAARRRGGGGALVEAAIEVARERGAYSLELTSAPWREEAKRLYPRLRFPRGRTKGLHVKH